MNETVSTGGETKLRILLAEDHEIVREGVRVMINSQPDMEVVGECGDGRAALRLASELRPDVLVMDISMPGVNGLRAAERVKKVCPEVAIITLTRHADLGFLKQLLGAGVNGYVLKQSASTELLRAIRTVASGGDHLDPAVAGKVMNDFARSRTKPRAQSQGDITEREAEVLRLIALGYSNKEIAAHLEISVKTVEVHKANAMRKLDMTSRIDVVRYALLQGWLQDS